MLVNLTISVPFLFLVIVIRNIFWLLVHPGPTTLLFQIYLSSSPSLSHTHIHRHTQHTHINQSLCLLCNSIRVSIFLFGIFLRVFVFTFLPENFLNWISADGTMQNKYLPLHGFDLLGKGSHDRRTVHIQTGRVQKRSGPVKENTNPYLTIILMKQREEM